MPLKDLEAIIAGGPEGIALPKPDGPVDVETLSRHLDRLEAQHGIEAGTTKILSIATESARAVTSLFLYPRTYLPRLFGLTWGAEDLATDMGAISNRDDSGAYTFTYQMVRSQMLIAAKASGVQAIEGVFTDFRDADGLVRYAKAGFEAGFNGMMAIHPAQVDIINQAFIPSASEIEQAHAIVDAFMEDEGTGVVSVGGKMLDIPHLKQAQKILAMVDVLKK